MGGGQICSEFVKREMDDNPSQREVLEAYYIGYAAGIISMFNFQAWKLNKLDGKTGTSFNASKFEFEDFTVRWLKTYCVSNPSTSMGVAVNTLYADLLRSGK